MRAGGGSPGMPASCTRGSMAAFGLPARTCAMELDLSLIETAAAEQGPVQAPVISPYPVATQDVALVVAQTVPAAAVEAALADGVAAAGTSVLLEDVRLFDVYTGEQAGAGRKSLAYSLRFRAPDRTLTAEEASAARDAAVAEAARQTGAVLRSGDRRASAARASQPGQRHGRRRAGGSSGGRRQDREDLVAALDALGCLPGLEHFRGVEPLAGPAVDLDRAAAAVSRGPAGHDRPGVIALDGHRGRAGDRAALHLDVHGNVGGRARGAARRDVGSGRATAGADPWLPPGPPASEQPAASRTAERPRGRPGSPGPATARCRHRLASEHASGASSPRHTSCRQLARRAQTDWAPDSARLWRARRVRQAET